jgi:hypothetical protein
MSESVNRDFLTGLLTTGQGGLHQSVLQSYQAQDYQIAAE